MKKFFVLLGVLLSTQFVDVKADVDPNFYIYLCFGQSNMEGNASPEGVDKNGVDPRFKLLATCDYTSPSRTTGQWYAAVPPLVNSVAGGLGPTDYFGRTMVAALPSNIRIGVVPVAMGGSPIEMFDKDKYAQKLAQNPNEWWAQIATTCYAGNPYGRLIEMGKKAQEVGVIKGILLHQGCSNCGDPNWPNMVKKIYNDMLSDLGLSADTVPLFVGEVLRAENGGSCAGHNTQVDRMPSVVPTSHVISSEDLPGNGTDPWHFSAMGYRILGKRYAFAALELMGYEKKAQPDYSFLTTGLKKFYAAKSISLADEVAGMPGQAIPVEATFGDNHKEDVTEYVKFTSDDITFINDRFLGNTEGQGTAQAVYQDFTLNEISKQFSVDVRFFPFKTENITKFSGTLTYDEAEHSFTMGASGKVGWQYKTGADLSAYKYLVFKLKEPLAADCKVVIKIMDKNNASAIQYKDTINDRTLVSVDLNNMVYNTVGSKVDPTHVSIVLFQFIKKGTLKVEDVFVTNDDAYSPTSINAVAQLPRKANIPVYNLQGMKLGTTANWDRMPVGVYVVNGKLIQKTK